MKYRLSRIAAVVAAAFPCIAFAEDAVLTLDNIVVTGSRVEHSSFDLPAAVDVVDAERIGADQARVNASEALAAVPGINVQNRQNYAQDLQISSRGFGARSAFGVRGMRLVADGIPASTPDGQGQVASFNLDRAERIEVLRGPMTAVYGNQAGGVIQIFTPDGKGAPTVEGNFAAGSYGTWKADLSAQGEVGGVGYVIDASRFSTDGYRDHSSATRDQTLAKLTFHPTQDDKVTLIASTFTQDAEDPQGVQWAEFKTNPRSVAFSTFSGGYFPAITFNTRKSIDQQQGGVTYEHRFGDQMLQLSAYVGQRSTIQYQSIPITSKAGGQYSAALKQTSDPLNPGGVIDFNRQYAGGSIRWLGKFDLAGGRLTTTVGADYEQSVDDRQAYNNFRVTDPVTKIRCDVDLTCGVKGDLRRDENDRVYSFAQYVQAEWQLDRWVVSGGLRHTYLSFNVDDHFLTNADGSNNGDSSGGVSFEKTTPTVAAMYRLTDAVNVYASAARGFETPTFNEMFYSVNLSGDVTGQTNLALKPSNSTSYEVGIKSMFGDYSRLDLALFQIKTDNEIAILKSDNGKTAYQNAGPTTRRGFEALLDSRWAYGFTTRVAYTYLDAKYDEEILDSSHHQTAAPGNKLPGVAANNLFGEIVWRHTATGFHIGLEGIARSKVYVNDANAESAPGYAIANVRFGVDRQYGALKLGTFLRLNNIFDRQYVGSVIVGDSNSRFYEAAPGFNWLAGVSARYAF